MYAEASRPSFPSDTNLFVDACVAQIREVARLESTVVLPPLPVVAPRRDVVIMTKAETPAVPCRPERELKATQLVARPSTAMPSRWPMAMCGFVAGAAACAAFLVSPVGHRPSVERATHAVRAHASHAAHATAAFFSR